MEEERNPEGIERTSVVAIIFACCGFHLAGLDRNDMVLKTRGLARTVGLPESIADTCCRLIRDPATRKWELAKLMDAVDLIVSPARYLRLCSGMDIVALQRVRIAKNHYSLVLADGRSVALGDVTRVLSQRSFRATIADATGRVFPAMKEDEWLRFTNACFLLVSDAEPEVRIDPLLFDVLRLIHSKVFDIAQVLSSKLGLLQLDRDLRDPAVRREVATRKHALFHSVEDARWYVHVPSAVGLLREAKHEMSVKQLSTLLVSAGGFVQHRIEDKSTLGIGGRPRFLVSPPGFPLREEMGMVVSEDEVPTSPRVLKPGADSAGDVGTTGAQDEGVRI